MYSFLVGNVKHKKAKGVDKNVVATVSHNEHKYFFLNDKYILHSMNKIQSKEHRIGRYTLGAGVGRVYNYLRTKSD